MWKHQALGEAMAASEPGSAKKEVGDNADLFPIARRKVDKFITDEIVIALCGPIGSPLHDVAEALFSSLVKDFGYDKECSAIIRLSDYIKKYGREAINFEINANLPNTARFLEIRSLISKGNQLRGAFSNSVLADLAIQEIAKSRTQKQETAPRRVFHIIDSIKNKDELEALRSVYGDMLYFVGVFSPLSAREKALTDTAAGMTSAEVHTLIDQDSGEEINNGQTVRDTFPQADYFIRIETDTNSQIKRKAERFLHLILGTQILTPTAAETAMYQAAAAAGGSACLSRQVGAAVTDSEGQILAVGWNDVPRSGGGLFTFTQADSTSEHDRRCWNINGGICFNDLEKDLLSQMVVDDLIRAKVIPPNEKEKAIKSIRSNKKLSGRIEFSRSIHAEMHAILNAGLNNGIRMKNGKIFITTYPCHSCARHIIATGIKEVYYIEPYRKSLAVKLHNDSITEHESEQSNKVRILMFEGVAPSRYMGIFKAPPESRKQNGKMPSLDMTSVKPRFAKTLEAVPVLESLKVKELEDLQLIPVD